MKINFSNKERSNDIKERLLKRHDEVVSGRISKSDVDEYKWISFFTKDENRVVRQPKMFDLYADLHKGACFEFKKDRLKEKNSKLKLSFEKIKYDSFFLNQKETIREEIGYKYYQWSDENEQRIIYKGGETSIDIEGCIEKIYLGALFFDDKIQVARLCELIEKKDLSVRMFSQVDVSGIGFLRNQSSMPDGTSVPKLTPYLSHNYRNRHKIDDDSEYERIDYREEGEFRRKYISPLEENRELNKEIKTALKKTISLQDKIISLNDELGEVKKELVEVVFDVINALTKIGTSE
jgi:hypothetical protein